MKIHSILTKWSCIRCWGIKMKSRHPEDLVTDLCKIWFLWAWPSWPEVGLPGLHLFKARPRHMGYSDWICWDQPRARAARDLALNQSGIWAFSLEEKWENTGHVHVEYFSISKFYFFHVMKCLFPRILFHSWGVWYVLRYQLEVLRPRGQHLDFQGPSALWLL